MVLVDLDLDQPLDARMRCQAGEAGIGDVVGARPIGDGVEVDFDDGREIFAAVTEDDRFRDIGAGTQRIFDERRRDGLAAGGDEKVTRTVDQSQRAVAPFANVASV